MSNYPPENDTPIFDRAAPPQDDLSGDHEIVDAQLVDAADVDEPGTNLSADTPLVYPLGDASVAAPPNDITAADDATSSTGGGADGVKNAAQGVAGDAKDAGAHVTGVAKEQASRVASEATDHARQLLGQASDGLKEQAGEQQQRAAGGLKNISAQLSSMADAADDGIAQKVVRDLSNRAGSLGNYLEGRDPGSLLDEVKSFAARRPGTFIAIAAGAGILAGRLTKALSTEIKHEKEADADGTGVGA